jgi:hypothetical protein
VILVFGVVVGIVIGFALELPAGMLLVWSPGRATAILRTVMNQLGQILSAPFVSIAFTLLYYDSRIRQEAFDLEMMAQNLGVTQVAALPGGAARSPKAASSAPRPSPCLATLAGARRADPGTIPGSISRPGPLRHRHEDLPAVRNPGATHPAELPELWRARSLPILPGIHALRRFPRRFPGFRGVLCWLPLLTTALLAGLTSARAETPAGLVARVDAAIRQVDAARDQGAPLPEPDLYFPESEEVSWGEGALRLENASLRAEWRGVPPEGNSRREALDRLRNRLAAVRAEVHPPGARPGDPLPAGWREKLAEVMSHSEFAKRRPRSRCSPGRFAG